MTHDQYPSVESKTPQTDALKHRLSDSILNGTMSAYIRTAVPADHMDEVVDVLDTNEITFAKVSEVLKPSVNSDVVRWVEQGNIPELTDEQKHLIFDLADEFGLRLPVDQELPGVDNPLLVIESGANKTSVVRRNLAEETLGENGGTMYQFGSDQRVISPTRKDKNGNEVENAEYKVITSEDVCGDLEGKSISEYEVNVASAITAGYNIVDDSQDDHIVLNKGNHRLVIVKSNSFKDGLTKLATSGLLEDRNVVISTNGQYRTKDIVDAESVIAETGAGVASLTAVGDETGKRDAKIYLAEFAVLLKKLSK